MVNTMHTLRRFIARSNLCGHSGVCNIVPCLVLYVICSSLFPLPLIDIECAESLDLVQTNHGEKGEVSVMPLMDEMFDLVQ